MSSPVRHVIHRQEYTPPTAAGVRRVLPEKWTAVATFAKPEDAHAEWHQLTLAARHTLNPFQLGGSSLFYQTSLPAFAFHDYLLDHGLTPPPSATSSNPNYVFWWVKHNRTFTDAQRAVVWQACDKLKLFEVVEEDDRRTAWLVVEVPWANQDGCQWVTTAEGGSVRSAWRSIRDARRTKQADDDMLRERFDETDEFTLHLRIGHEQSDPWLNRGQVPFADLLRVPLVEAGPLPTVHMLVRESSSLKYGKIEVDPSNNRRNSGARVAVCGATSRSVVEQEMAERVRMARATVNPFALLDDWDGRGHFEMLLTVDERDDRRLPNDLTLEEAVEILRRLDTTPPPPEANELLADWYDQVVQWSPEYIDVIWGTFADFRLFEVVEVPFG